MEKYSEENFEIVCPVHEGKIFRVFKARAGTKYVILKSIVSSDSMSQSFLRKEYELSCTLHHPCLGNVIGFCIDSPIGPAIVLEYIDGVTLNEFLKKDPSLSLKKSVLKDILDGLDYLHRRGVFHNDLRPDNIIVLQISSKHDKADFVVYAGFGPGGAFRYPILSTLFH